MNSKVITILVTVVAVVLIGTIVFFGLTPKGVEVWNEWTHSLQKADDSTNYEAKKQVEDTCRASISNYEYYVLTYEQYKDSKIEKERAWAQDAKMMANRTASTYNNYFLENSYVWAGNVPADIRSELPYLT